MNGLVATLAWAARHGRPILVLGLLAGISFPELAALLRPWIGPLVAMLLFIAALRVGPRQVVGAFADLRRSIGYAIIFQLAFPLAIAAIFWFSGWSGALVTALILMASASPISGSPNLTILTGHDPAPALRQLVVGTAMLPLTVIPIFWLMPALGQMVDVFVAAGRLLVIIGLAAAAGFALRSLFLNNPGRGALSAIDGLSALAMAVVVVALMSAVGPALWHQPQSLALTLIAAFAANFGMQFAVAWWLRRRGPARLAVPLGIVAGNRNIALFLAALPTAVTEPLLLFIGCYQIPMYLTPILLSRLYGQTSFTMRNSQPRG